MKIALIGYGKMGKAIEQIAIERGHEIVATLDFAPTVENIKNPDVAIEFSTPETAFNNVSFCIDNNIPVISGTTGWIEKIPKIEQKCKNKKGAFLYSSNFSLGVNLFFEINKKVAELMKNHASEYNVRMEEIHHTQKLDAPSGTAISLAKDVISEFNFNGWKLSKTTENNELGIEAKRIENVPGTHIVYYKSEVDEIEIKHTAFSRKGFALGAVIAAEWINGKEGIFSMKNILGL